jgi:hypothetical protein
LVFALGMARFANVLELDISALVLVAISMPFCILFDITFAHVLERVFLVWALAAHAGRRRSQALALTTVAALVKPSMGFVYGLLLLIVILMALWRKAELSVASVVREVRLAAIVGTSLLFASVAVYGLQENFKLALPLTGMEVYRISHFGFFTGAGHAFWYFPGVHFGYYLGTPIGFWLAASISLLVGGCLAASSVLASFKNLQPPAAACEITLCCTLLHLAFVILFFGNNASWTSYPYLLSMGVAAMTLWVTHSRLLVWFLIIIGVAGQKGIIDKNLHDWLNSAPSNTTAGLWATREERQEWAYVLSQLQGKATVVLVFDGSAELLFGQLSRPVVVTLIRGLTGTDELKRKIDQLSAAQFAIVPEVPNSLGFLDSWPEIKDPLLKWGKVVFRGKYFTLYQRADAKGATDRAYPEMRGGAPIPSSIQWVAAA